MPFDFRIKTTAKVKQFMFAFAVPFTSRMFRFTFQTYKNPTTLTTGISSRCKDGRQVLFFDYDNQDLMQVVDEIKYLQEVFKLYDRVRFRVRQR